MRDWRNRQTRAFKGRVGDRVGSSPTSRTITRTTLSGRTRKGTQKSVPFSYAPFCLSARDVRLCEYEIT